MNWIGFLLTVIAIIVLRQIILKKAGIVTPMRFLVASMILSGLFIAAGAIAQIWGMKTMDGIKKPIAVILSATEGTPYNETVANATIQLLDVAIKSAAMKGFGQGVMLAGAIFGLFAGYVWKRVAIYKVVKK